MDLTGKGCLQPVPEPVLQRPETDEHGIGLRAEAVLAAVPGPMPGQFSRLDQHEPRGCLGAHGVVHQGIGGESGDVRER